MATATATAYGFRDVSVIYKGIAIDGFFDGDDQVKLAPTTELVSMKVGADGKGVYNLGADISGTLSLKLLAASASNDILAADYALLRAGEFSGGPVYVKSTHGTALFAGTFVIKSWPTDFGFGREDTGRTWELVSTSVEIFPGMAGRIVSQ